MLRTTQERGECEGEGTTEGLGIRDGTPRRLFKSVSGFGGSCWREVRFIRGQIVLVSYRFPEHPPRGHRAELAAADTKKRFKYVFPGDQRG